MPDTARFEQRLASLLGEAAERRAQEGRRRDDVMRDVEPRRIRFEQAASAWMTDLVIPRLQTLAQALSLTAEVEHVGGGCSVLLKVGSSEAYPVAASLSVSITPNTSYEHASVHIKPLLIPMFVGHPAAACREFEVDVAAAELLARFLDDEFVVFADSYLRVREPSSPYQRRSLVTDPVCGMTFHPMDAVESHEHEGKRYFFCASACAERFRQSPGHFLKPGHGTTGGSQ